MLYVSRLISLDISFGVGKVTVIRALVEEEEDRNNTVEARDADSTNEGEKLMDDETAFVDNDIFVLICSVSGNVENRPGS